MVGVTSAVYIMVSSPLEGRSWTMQYAVNKPRQLPAWSYHNLFFKIDIVHTQYEFSNM